MPGRPADSLIFSWPRNDKHAAAVEDENATRRVDSIAPGAAPERFRLIRWTRFFSARVPFLSPAPASNTCFNAIDIRQGNESVHPSIDRLDPGTPQLEDGVYLRRRARLHNSSRPLYIPAMRFSRRQECRFRCVRYS